MNRSSSDKIDNISSLHKLNKSQLIDWFLNSAEPQVMISCLLSKLQASNANQDMLNEVRSLLDEMPAQRSSVSVSEMPSVGLLESSAPLPRVGSRVMSLEDLKSKTYNDVENYVSKLDYDSKEKLLESLLTKIKYWKENSDPNLINKIIEYKNVFMFLDEQIDKNKYSTTRVSIKNVLNKRKSGFGRTSHQSYRRHSNTKRMLCKSKGRKSKGRKSGRKSKGRKSKGRKSRGSKSKVRSNKRKIGSRNKSSFGKTYGLQNGPNWKGVFPMDLNVIGSFPTLLFGKQKVRRSNKKYKKLKSKSRKLKSKKLKSKSRKLKSKKRSKRVHKKRSFGAPPPPGTFLRKR